MFNNLFRRKRIANEPTYPYKNDKEKLNIEKFETKKEKVDIEKQRKTIKCSKCGRYLKPIGSILDKGLFITDGQMTKEDLQTWLGSVCTNCHIIFCSDCQVKIIGRFDPWDPCPNCGQTLKTATTIYLKQIGKL